MFLSRDDVFRITHRKKFTAQRRVLDAKGIRYLIAETGDKGEPLVTWDWVKEAVTGQKGAGKGRSGHRWDRIGEARR